MFRPVLDSFLEKLNALILKEQKMMAKRLLAVANTQEMEVERNG